MFQDSYASMDPRMRVGTILREPLTSSTSEAQGQRQQRIDALLDEVGLPSTALDRYPHEFSGGQRQRLGLARALMLRPKLIVADEPVSALDVSIQAQILNLMLDLQRDLGLTYLFISHDLSVVRYLSDIIGVMYLGKLVEMGPADDVYSARCTPTRRASSTPSRSPTQTPSGPRTARAWPGSCPAPSTRRPAAGSAPGARGPRSSAPSKSLRCDRSARTGTWQPATSRCNPH